MSTFNSNKQSKTETNHDGNNAQSVAVAEPFIDKPEVARRLSKTLRTVDNWMGRGLLPYYKIGRSVSFKWSEVEAHLAQTCRVCHINIGK